MTSLTCVDWITEPLPVALLSARTGDSPDDCASSTAGRRSEADSILFVWLGFFFGLSAAPCRWGYERRFDHEASSKSYELTQHNMIAS